MKVRLENDKVRVIKEVVSKIDLIVSRKDEKDNPLVELAIEEGVRV